MKRFFQNSFLVLCTLALAMTAACSSNGASNANNRNDNGASPGASNSSDSGNASEESDGPFGKYDPPITMRATMIETDFLNEGDTVEDNVWTRGYSEELGVQVKYDWVVDGANAGEKMNITLASGDLPDLLGVNQSQFKQLLEAGQLEDLSEVYEKYASPQLKEFYSSGADGLLPARSDDKLYGLTYYSGSYDTSPMLWIRTDWMNNLGLKPPATMDEAIGMIKAFAEEDPDRNGKDDTYGIQLNKDLFGGGDFNPVGFANGYHAYPGHWFKDDSGKASYGSILPEMKTVLGKLQEMYKAGYIDPEFGTKDVAKAGETVMSDKVGLFFGYMTSPFSVSGMIKDGSTADWLPYPIPSADDKPALVQNNMSFGSIYAVRKGYEHPEALIKLMNFAVEKMFGESAAAESANYLGSSGQGFQAAPVRLLKPNKNVFIYQNVVAALEANDPSALNTEEKSYFDGITKYRGGDKSQWWFERIFGPDSSQKVIQQYIDNDAITMNEWVYPPTDTMVSKGGTLGKLELETFVKIIYGQAPVDAFDKFVEDWKKLGGEKMMEEVNQVLQ
ncbi:extracellular solute-binding protein [Paenibacillus arenilitoris]|uniref:Extracellular solute-binding protein n=1 Tax=Paenibacillus arenilitoris TaxID=2772299 RepID=A0A927H370_9BACL|nr:extracellular solute-binding protein [Paenibacillus arenilitoris]MBD2867001.1 extracellular solute-binding protein [Paenibacillus arenilitoris]